MEAGGGLSCDLCGAPRGEQKYCWRCGAEMQPISVEDLLRFDIRKVNKERRYGCSVTVNGVLQGKKDIGGSK